MKRSLSPPRAERQLAFCIEHPQSIGPGLVKPASLGANKTLAFRVAASKYALLYEQARADAAPERVDPYAEDGCKNTALHIKPSMIADESLREEAINAFGPAPFDLDGTDVGFHFYTQYGQFDGTKFERKEGLRVCETHRYNPITTFIHDKDFTTFLDDKTAATAEDEIVTVKIKLGKGGWQHFQCKKSDAKDMQGDKY